jgi:hypothetical protein
LISSSKKSVTKMGKLKEKTYPKKKRKEDNDPYVNE